jgi:integrase
LWLSGAKPSIGMSLAIPRCGIQTRRRNQARPGAWLASPATGHRQPLGELYADLLERGLSPASVRHVHVVAHRALRDAVRNDLIARNPADAATSPRVARKEPSVWTPAQLRTFLTAAEGDRSYAAWWLLSTAGLRRGEALGLRWLDLNLDTRRLAVTRSLVQRGRELSFNAPKTRRGRRSLALDERTVTILEAHRPRPARGANRPRPWTPGDRKRSSSPTRSVNR